MFPNNASEFVYTRTYSRWLEEEKRREFWPETVRRYLDFIIKHRGNLIPTKVLKKMEDKILKFEVMPSMRAMWAAGPAAEFDNTTMYNCFKRNTRFITSNGVKSFEDFQHNQEITVLSHEGTWEKAVVKLYGKRKLNKILYKKGKNGNIHEVFATPNHRWLLSNGTETTSLKINDTLLHGPSIFNQFKYSDASIDEKMYWCYGYVYGDGTKVKNTNGEYKYSMVRLCKKDDIFKYRFEEMGFKTSTNNSLNGDFYAYTGSYLKTLPDLNVESPEMIRAFIAGYMDADGAKNYNNQKFKSIQVTGIESISFLRQALSVAGLYIQREDDFTNQETNFGKRSDLTIRFAIHDGSIVESNSAWKIVDISEDSEEDVWCLEVQNKQSFVLDTGISTGNCSFQTIKSIESFAEAFYVLLCGTGYGFSVENKYILQLPDVPTLNVFQDKIKSTIDDSKKGWADSVKLLIESLYQGIDVDFDYSIIRPKGARLITMGGRASGPDPLIILHSFIREIFNKAQGRKLYSLECHDILNQIAEAVIVAGVRRSSEISLSDLDDEMMRNAKNFPFPPRRYMANNSAVYYEKPSAVDFLKEWSTLASSGTGERGIINLYSAHQNSPKRRDSLQISGTNPCVTGETEILTKDGYKRIDSLIDNEYEIWNGFEWSCVIPTITGYNQKILNITFSDGRQLNCTPYHKFHIADGYTGKSYIIQAEDLDIGMKLIKHNFPIIEHGDEYKYAYTQGFISAEGMDGYNFIHIYEPKKMCIERLNGKLNKWNDKYKKGHFILDHEPLLKSFVPFNWNLKSKLNWLAGLFDGDGCELKEGGLQLVSVNYLFLANLQKLLSTLGTQSKITLASDAGYKQLPDGQGNHKDYYCQTAHRILIGAVQMQELKRLGLQCERLLFDKKPQRDASQFITITNIIENEIAEKVYCFNEPKRHLGIFNGIITGQCGEILLRDKQFCNLSEVVIRVTDDLDDILEKIETATWIGAIQSTFTHFPYLSKEWKKNCEEERLLGVSLTGQMDNHKILGEEGLRLLKAKAIKVAKKASEILNINIPTAVTCVKPSGTVSQLVDSASGIHPRFAKYYIRRYRISANDPLFKMIKDQGIKVSPENGQEDLPEDKISTYVLSFPIKAPKESITKDQMTAIEQLEWYKKIQTNWCEHNASMTVYVKDNEWFEVGNWVYQNLDIINGVSFLPFDGGKYKQAPYEEITEEKYNKLIENFKNIDYSMLSKYEQEDNTEGSKSLACTSDKCDIT